MRPRDHLVMLDLVRIAAALFVVAHHYTAMFALSHDSFLAVVTPEVRVTPDLAGATWWGWVGVEIFFVLSGYVIAASAVGQDGRGFLAKRAWRLAPTAWLCATLTALATLAVAVQPAGTVAAHWAASVAFLPVLTQIDGSYWSLGVEVAFYLLVAPMLGRADDARALERLAAGLLGVALAGAALRFAGADAFVASRPAELLLLPHGGLFAAGIALWAIHQAGASRSRLLVLCFGLATGAAEIVATAQFMATGLGLAAGPALPLTAFALSVVAIAGAPRLQPRLAGLRHRALIARLALATYPLYLLHQHIGAIVIGTLRRAGAGSLVATLAATALAAALAGWVAWSAEPWLRRALRDALNRAGRSRAPAPDTPPSAFPRAG